MHLYPPPSIGDYIKIEPKEVGLECHILVIDRMFKDDKGEPHLKGHSFLQPKETFHLATRKFLQKEVFKSDKYETVHFR